MESLTFVLFVQNIIKKKEEIAFLYYLQRIKHVLKYFIMIFKLTNAKNILLVYLKTAFISTLMQMNANYVLNLDTISNQELANKLKIACFQME